MEHDLLFIVDTSTYRSCYLRSLTASLPEVISISTQTRCFSRIGVLAYHGYRCDNVLEWSGWLNQGEQRHSQEQQPDLVAFAKRLRANKNPEPQSAIKTALAKACEVMRSNAKTLIFLYADTRPIPNVYYPGDFCSGPMEKAALLAPGSYSLYGFACIDWVSACNALRDGPKQAQVFTVLHKFVGEANAAWYIYLSTRTDGACVQVKSNLKGDIAKVTVDLLLSWTEVEKGPSSVKEGQEDFLANLLRYISVTEIDSIENERDKSTFPYFLSEMWMNMYGNENISKVELTTDVMKEYVPRKTAPMPDFAEEITSIINSVPDTEMYPCAFLDPTLDFSHKRHDYAYDGANRPVSYMTRSEFLQIGRSCNPGVLRQFGAILTRLTVVASAREMPDHISSTDADHVAKIPLVLIKEKYNRQFWKVLLHTIEPGTKLPARSAALLAALSLRMGIVPLMKVAEQEMLAFKDKWNDPSIPQTWTLGCLTLLIDADEAHQKQQDMSLTDNRSRILHPTDITLFDRLITFKRLEQHTDAQLQARVTRIADKTIAPVGPLVTCRECQYPRSVTMMGANGKCGLCLGSYEEQKHKYINRGVSVYTDATSKAIWVECSSRSCRAQYVVYHPDGLRMSRPAKCYYCRSQGSRDNSSDHVTQDASPAQPASFKESDFICPLCTSGYDLTTTLEVTPYKLFTENKFSWLVQDANGQEVCFQKDFNSHIRSESIFQIITRLGSEGFLSRIRLFPSSEPQLRYDGKPIHNSKELVSTLQKLVADGKTSDNNCSLCFDQPRKVYPACGRDGCPQRMCAICLERWHKYNSAGCVINTEMLGCPFCRRYPIPRLLAKYGLLIHSVKDLDKAVRDKGKFIYAWCFECATAKVVRERSCMLGKPLELKGWICDECLREILRKRSVNVSTVIEDT
ncbi:hypothetical protein N7519_009288 [Penicillium mononematosum]|uniref:uncharacterized protein n=1 Tax=Penicillium mononematosum TaxID=268346 RepID=UPI0025482089|nr:uncharacterized protein N7519_009288 [Penicillium mononematosum]KAJ6178827.1 hypothetical protein N7519_009288 [Penicillium mononematosum]